MRWTHKYFAATGIHLPARVSVAAEVAAGRYDSAEARHTGMVEFCRAPAGASALEYAADAARAAIASVSADHLAPLRALYFTHVGPPGGPLAWNPAGKVHELLRLDTTVTPFGLSNGCALGLAAVEEACLRLHGDPDKRPGAVVLAAAEVWPPAFVDQATSARGLILADGGAAAVVSNLGGFAEILATSCQIDSGLADATRGAHPLAYNPAAIVDLPARYDHFAAHGMPHHIYRHRRDRLIDAVVTEALADAAVRLDQIDAYIHTHSGKRNLDHGYYRLFPAAAKKINTAAIGHGIGHVGTADTLIGLHLLHTTRKLKPGALVLMITGAGGWLEAAVVARVL